MDSPHIKLEALSSVPLHHQREPFVDETTEERGPEVEAAGGAGGGGEAAVAVRGGVRALMDPLGVVVGFAELLLDESLDAEERGRFTRCIHEAACQLERQVRHLEVITRGGGEREEQLPLF